MLDWLANVPVLDRLLWYAFLSLLALPLGACIGSFLNVCIYRIPREMSVVTPRSHCPRCGTMIPWYWNIPILSYLALGARCRFCGGKISPRYALVEAVTGIFFVMVWLKYIPVPAMTPPFGLDPLPDLAVVPILWLMISGLILGTFIDFEHLIIPDRVTLGGILAGLLLSGLVPALHGEQEVLRGLLWSSLGALLGWGILWFIAIAGSFFLKKDAMGFGDVKLLSAIGAFLGPKAVIFTLVISSLLGSIVGITLVLTGRRQMQSRIPYGPYLALAAILWIFWGLHLWNLYDRFFLNLWVEPLPDTSFPYQAP